MHNDRLLKDWISAFIEYSSNTEVPKIFRIWSALFTVASVMERKTYLDLGTLRIRPNMYVVIVGFSGSRKTAGMRLIRPFISQLEGFNIAPSKVVHEQLIRRLAEGLKGYMFNGELVEHNSISILAEELAVFIGRNNLDFTDTLTELWDCPTNWDYETKHQGKDFIPAACANMLGAITPQVLNSIITKDQIYGGFTSRIIYVYNSEKVKKKPIPSLSKEQSDLIPLLVTDLKRIYALKGKFTYTPEFIDMYKEYYLNYPEIPEDSPFSGYYSRRATHLLKLCLAYCASRTDSMIIEAQDLNYALQILDITEQNMIKSFSISGRNDLAPVISNIIKFLAIQNKAISKSELGYKFMNEVKQYELDGIVEQLRSVNVIKTSVVGNNIMIKFIGKAK